MILYFLLIYKENRINFDMTEIFSNLKISYNYDNVNYNPILLSVFNKLDELILTINFSNEHLDEKIIAVGMHTIFEASKSKPINNLNNDTFLFSNSIHEDGIQRKCTKFSKLDFIFYLIYEGELLPNIKEKIMEDFFKSNPDTDELQKRHDQQNLIQKLRQIKPTIL